MNHIHRSIWNESLGAWVATAEITRARGKSSQTATGAVRSAVTVGLSLSAALLTHSAWAACTFSQTAAGGPVSLTVTAPDTFASCTATRNYFSVNTTGMTTPPGNHDNTGATYEGLAAVGALAAGIDTKAAYKNATAVGSSLFVGGRNSVAVGFGSTINVDRANGFTPLIVGQPATGAQLGGMGAVAIGSYNSMGTSDVNAASTTTAIPAATLRFDALANAITGVANTVNQGNGTLIYGSGNTVTNSIKPLNLQKIQSNVPEVNQWVFARFIASLPGATQAQKDAAAAAEVTMLKALVTYTAKNEELGSVGIFGGANTATNAESSMLSGIRNNLTNGSKVMVSGYGNTANAVQESQVTGNSNTLEGPLAGNPPARVSSNIVIGNRNTLLSVGMQNTVIGNDNNGETFDANGVKMTGALGGNLVGNQIIGSAVTVADNVKDGVIIGRGGKLGANNTIAIGTGAQALGQSSIAIGTGHRVEANNAGAFGDPITINAGADGSYGIGNNITISSANTFVLGSNIATGTVANSVYLGDYSAASTAIGANTAGTTAVSSATVGTNTYTFKGGVGTPAGVVTVGAPGSERRIQNVAAGLVSETSTDAINGSQLYAVAALAATGGVQYYSVNDTNAVRVNPDPTNKTNLGATGVKALAAGIGASATAEGDMAIGNAAKTITSTSFSTPGSGGGVALGDAAQAYGNNTISIGHQAGQDAIESSTGNYYNVAIGSSAGQFVSGHLNTAIGQIAGTKVTGDGNSAFGSNAGVTVTGNTNTALGQSAGTNVKGNNNTATGNMAGAYVTGSSNVTMGDNAGTFVKGSNNIAIGTGSTHLSTLKNPDDTFKDVNNAIAIGTGAKTTDANRAVALGGGTSVVVADGVALGSRSVSDRATNLVGYVPTSASATDIAATTKGALGAVSVGTATATRQIINVAAGTDNTDAVNVAQLKALSQVVDGGLTFKGNDNTATPNAAGTKRVMGNALNITGGASGAASNANVKTVVTEGQVDIQLLNSPTFTGTVTANTFVAGGVNIVGANPATGQTANTVTGLSNTMLNAPGFGTLGRAATEEQLAQVNASATAGWTVTTGTSGSGTQTGTQALTAVKPGDTVSVIAGDNIAVGQSGNAITIATNKQVAFDQVKVGPVTIHNATGIDAGNTQITGVKAGTAGTDAVNVSQLTQQTTALTTKGLDFSGNSGGAVHRDLGTSLAIQGQASTAGNYSGANLKTVTDPANGAINLQLAESPRFGALTLNDAGSGKITGLTAGTADTDAVNVSQLKAVDAVANAGWNYTTGVAQGSTGQASAPVVTPVKPGDTVTYVAGNNIALTQQGSQLQVATNPDLVVTSVTASDKLAIGTTGPSLSTTGIDAAGTKVTRVAPATLSASSQDAVNGSQLYQLGSSTAQALGGSSSFNPTTGSVTAGLAVGGKVYNTVQDALNNFTVGAGGGWTAATATTGSGSFIGGTKPAAAVVMPGDTLTYTAGDNIAIGQSGNTLTIATNPNLQVTSVTASDKLAITGGPSLSGGGIDAASKPISNVAAGVKPTDAVNVSQLGALGNRIDAVEQNAYAGVAAAMALQMPAHYLPGKTVMRVGTAVFKGQGALGLSFRRTTDNSRFSISGGVATSAAGVAGSLGLEWVLD